MPFSQGWRGADFAGSARRDLHQLSLTHSLLVNRQERGRGKQAALSCFPDYPFGNTWSSQGQLVNDSPERETMCVSVGARSATGLSYPEAAVAVLLLGLRVHIVSILLWTQRM